MESEDSSITIYLSYFIPCVDGKSFFYPLRKFTVNVRFLTLLCIEVTSGQLLSVDLGASSYALQPSCKP